MTRDHLAAIGHAIIAHCPHRLGLSERWARDSTAAWKILRHNCPACDQVAAALGIEEPSLTDILEH